MPPATGVNQLCTLQRLWSIHARKRGRSRRPRPPVHDDLVKNVLNRRHRRTREQLRLAIIVWIEKTYHRRSRRATIDRVRDAHQTAHAA